MPCQPLMCCGAEDCLDRHCPGNPCNLGYESAGNWPQPADDCELIGPAEAAIAAALGVVAVLVFLAGAAWAVYTLWPLVAALS
jgi:hypothetical protein